MFHAESNNTNNNNWHLFRLLEWLVQKRYMNGSYIQKLYISYNKNTTTIIIHFAALRGKTTHGMEEK